MHRREFILKSSALLAAGMAGQLALPGQTAAPAAPALPPPAGPFAPPPPVEFKLLRRNVGIFNGRGGTVAWLASPDALVVVDTQFAGTAAQLVRGLPGRNGRQIDVLINSHHHPDHTGGNSVFRAVTKTIVAQKLVPDIQFAQAKGQGTLNYQTYADTTFDESWRFDAGDETVSVRFLGGQAHTGSDSIIHFEKANVVDVADFVFNRQYPMTDRPGGCLIRGWIEKIEQLTKIYPADAIYVFGHAKAGYDVVGTQADLFAQRDYLTGLLDFVGGEIKAGKTKLVATEIPGFPDWRAPQPNFLGRNLAAAWEELHGIPPAPYGPAVPAAPAKA